MKIILRVSFPLKSVSIWSYYVKSFGVIYEVVFFIFYVWYVYKNILFIHHVIRLPTYCTNPISDANLDVKMKICIWNSQWCFAYTKLSQKHCKLIGWYSKIMRRQLWTLTWPTRMVDNDDTFQTEEANSHGRCLF